METRLKGVEELVEPIWFDTGRKMQDGKTPRLVGAYDTKQLAEYKDKKTFLDTYDEDGAEEFILWKRMGKASDVVKTVKEPNNGMTTTPSARGRKQVQKNG